MTNYCAFENRPNARIGVKLLALSLEKHCRNFTLYLGVLEQDPELADWLRRRAPHAVQVQLTPFAQGSSIKHVKPVFILELFARGLTEVTWLDTDLLVLKDPAELLASLDSETILVAQDMDHLFEFNPRLLEHYRLSPLRKLESRVNTCILRVTTRHKVLLEKFLDFLLDPLFLEEQEKPSLERAQDFAYEQKILELLLCASGPGWTPAFPVRFIPEGSGIIQELGVTTYGLRDRFLNGLGWNRPWFVHAPGEIKPWLPDPHSRSYRGASVYSSFAERYRNQVEEEMSWTNSAGLSSRIGRLLNFGKSHWMGWAHCLAGKTWRLLRTGTLERN
jgi:hypothetical protein